MPTFSSPPPPELLYLLAGDEEDLLAACQDLRVIYFTVALLILKGTLL